MNDTMARLEALTDSWLTLPDIAEAWGVGISEVRRLVDDDELIAVKRGTPKVLQVPSNLVLPTLVERLAGTITLLLDAGFSREEALAWLLTDDPTLPGTPLQNLRDGRRAEIRRRAQALAF